MMNNVNLRINCSLRILLTFAFAVVLLPVRAGAQLPDGNELLKKLGAKPEPAPARYRGLIGEYGSDDSIMIVLESGGRLVVQSKQQSDALRESSRNNFAVLAGPRQGQSVVFTRNASGRATMLQFAGSPY